jgi:hypothetical protein
MASLTYPRTIRVSRVGYANNGGGLEPVDTQILVGVPASIQMKRKGSSASAIPVSSASNSVVSAWIVFFTAPIGTVQKGDKVTDDLEQTYEVETPYHTGFGYQCECRIYKP